MAEGQRPMVRKDGDQIMHDSANASSQDMKNMMNNMANMMSAITKINDQLAQASAKANNQNTPAETQNNENGDAENNNGKNEHDRIASILRKPSAFRGEDRKENVRGWIDRIDSYANFAVIPDKAKFAKMRMEGRAKLWAKINIREGAPFEEFKEKFIAQCCLLEKIKGRAASGRTGDKEAARAIMQSYSISCARK